MLAVLAPEPTADSQPAYGIRRVLNESLRDDARLSAAGVPAATSIALGTTSRHAAFERHQPRPAYEPKHLGAYPLVPEACADLHGKRP